MSYYRDDLQCDKVIDKEGNKCGKSPARQLSILNINLCREHQKELTRFLCQQLGESWEEEK